MHLQAIQPPLRARVYRPGEFRHTANSPSATNGGRVTLRRTGREHGDTSKAALLTDEERGSSMVISDPSLSDTPIIFISGEFEQQTGYPPEEVLGRNCRFLQGPETDPKAVQAIRDALAAKTKITIDILNYRKDGSKFWNRLRIRPVFNAQGEISYFVGNQNPIPAEDVRP